MQKLILIDGNSLVNRAFFGLPPMTSRDGTPSNAIYGFVNMLLKLNEQFSPEYLVVTFDLPGVNFRHQQFAEYKGTRKGMPDELKVQMPLLKNLLKAMNIAIVEQAGIEADDLMGTLTRRYPDVHKYVVTADRDCLQLISDDTTVLLTKKGITELHAMDRHALQDEWGFRPSQIIDYKALCGDASDNIPGVAGIGDKTALSLLQKYDNLDNIYKHIDEIKGAQNTKLQNGKANAYMSYTLATIVLDVDIKLELEQAKFSFPFKSKVKDEFAKLSFSSLVKRSDLFLAPDINDVSEASTSRVGDASDGASNSSSSTVDGSDLLDDADNNYSSNKISTPKPKFDIIRIKTLDNLKEILNTNKYEKVYLHIGENELQFVLADVSKNSDEYTQYTFSINNDESKHFSIDDIVAHLTLLFDEKYTVVFYDAKNYMHRFEGLKCQYQDARLMQYLVDISQSSDSVIEWAGDCGFDASEIGVCIAHISKKLMESLAKLSLLDLYTDIELPLVKVLYKMEKRGFAINVDTLKKLQVIYGAELETLATSIKGIAGQEFNIQSPKQLSKVLFEDMGLQYPYKKPKTLSTSADILKDMDDETGIVELILKYRELAKLKSTYVDALLKTEVKPTLLDLMNTGIDDPDSHIKNSKKDASGSNISSKGYSENTNALNSEIIDPNIKENYTNISGDNTHYEYRNLVVVHTNFRQTFVATGRLSSVEPNLQNIPVRTEQGRNLRKAFVARSGYSLLCVDYSQIELRLLAHLSSDPIMSLAFRNGEDIHSVTAAQVYGVDLSLVTSDMRRLAKVVNFGILYGKSDFGLAKELKISVADAKKFIQTYFEKYNVVKSYLDECVEYATEHGYIKSLSGRIRYIPELRTTKLKKHGQRIAMNMPMQGSASDIIKIAMLKVYDAIKSYDAYLIHQVHDELIVECKDDQIEQVSKLIVENMIGASKLNVPLEVDVEVCKEWV